MLNGSGIGNKVGLILASVRIWKCALPCLDICSEEVHPAFDRILHAVWCGCGGLDCRQAIGEMVCLKGQRIESIALSED